MLEGSITVNLETGSKVYGPGDAFMRPAGQHQSSTNAGTTLARWHVGSLRPQVGGSQVFTVVQPSPLWVR